MKIFLSVLLSLCSLSSLANKIYPVKGGDDGIFLTGSNYDTIVIRSSQNPYAYIYLKTKGTSIKWVTVINEGQVDFSVGNNGIEVDDCSYIRITGTGSGLTRGFNFHNKPGVAITIHNHSDHILLENFRVDNMTYAVWCKNEASCDATLNYPNHALHDIEVRNFDFSNIGQDVMYMGSTGGTGGRSVTCNGVTQNNVISSRMYNILVHDGTMTHANRTGIQLSGADSGVNKIYNLVITGMGYEFDDAQGAAVFLGADTKDCEVYNITAKLTWEHAIWSYGIGNVSIHDNHIDSTGILYGTRTYQRNGHSDTTITGWLRIGYYNSSGTTFVPWAESPIYISSFSNFTNRPITLSVKNNVDTGFSTDPNYDVIVDDPLNEVTGGVICNSGIVDNNSNAVFSTTGCGTANLNPVVTTSGDQTITLPTTTASISGNATDADGTIASHIWTKISGSGTITSPASYSTTITGLGAGQTVLQLSATDNLGGIGIAELTITVNSATNTNPVVNAGNDTSITLPVNTVQLNATVTDDDTSGVTFKWKRITGGIPLTSKTIRNPIASFNTAGVYFLRVRATDNAGLVSKWDTISITVNPLPLNDSPVANAGQDVIIYTPVNQTILNGSGSFDNDGFVSTFRWSHLSGGVYTFSDSTLASPLVSLLENGIHIFLLTVTDDRGAISYDSVQVEVIGCNCGCTLVGIMPFSVAQAYGVGSTRDAIILQQWTGVPYRNNTISRIKGWDKVTININHQPINSLPQPYTPNIALYKDTVGKIIDTLGINTIYSCENEENTAIYHTEPLSKYFLQLDAFGQVCDQKKVRWSNGGLTQEAGAWYYNKTGDTAFKVNLSNPQTQYRIRLADSCIEKYKSITSPGFVFNFHLYADSVKDVVAIERMVSYIKAYTGKNVYSNESGYYNEDINILKTLLSLAIRERFSNIVFYSGDYDDSDGRAKPISQSDFLQLSR